VCVFVEDETAGVGVLVGRELGLRLRHRPLTSTKRNAHEINRGDRATRWPRRVV
jgi:hypothetical protein